jgi:serine protease Do
MKKMSYAISSALLMAIIAGTPLTAIASLPSAVNGQSTSSLAPMLTKIMPAVVNISAIGEVYDNAGPEAQPNPNSQSNPNNANNSDNQGNQGQNNQGNQGNQNQGPRKFAALGSGVIVDAAKGYILTNAHVIRDARVVTVTLSDGRQKIAKIIGIDPPSDVAVLQIEAKDLTSIPLANSDDLKVGDFVVAIGNPFGLSQTVTSGIVSALQRTDLGIDGVENFIQTDAPINLGNSGGALANLQGQLIGINTAILAPDGGGSIGIGFAIPSNMAKSIMMQLINYGSVRRGLLGIMIQTLNPSLADAFNMPNGTGVVVAQVNPNSPAARAGMQAGDIIQQVDGQKVTNSSQVTNIVGLVRAGSPVNLNILRNGKSIDMHIVITTPNQYLQTTREANPLLFGINLQDFSQISAFHGPVQGVQITGVAEESPAGQAKPVGLRPGDVVISANLKPVHNITELMAEAKQSKQLLLNVLRGGAAMFVVLK